MRIRARTRRLELLSILCCAVVLSLFTVTVQIRAMGFDRLQEGGFQVNNHREVMEGRRGNPFQYRILSEWVVEGFIQAYSTTKVPFPSALAFFTVRMLQNILIFTFAAYYYKRLGLSTYTAILGLVILAWSMSQALYAADLQFNTYGDVLFYLLAALVIAQGRDAWIIPITFLAAFNRETSGLIPIMLIAARMQITPDAIQKVTVPRRVLTVAGIALALYALVFVGLRIAYAPQATLVPYGHQIGLGLFIYNLTLPATYVEVFGVLSLIPILALVAMRRWHMLLTRFFWAVVPIWFIVHIFASVLAESRLLLVPMALVFIPGALVGTVNTRMREAVK